ncbi:MAG TPA: hypothetical protein VGQ57_03400 [Polyangiaceae bacterium]|nr:hypothetical protein [Polyangiaceae bacterium]
MFKAVPFELIDDEEGSVTVGWAGDTSLYALVEGGLSAKLGGRLAHRVQELVQGLSGVHYFGDSALMSRYDLLARSSFVRMALANRRAFASFTFLIWPDGVSSAAQAFADALGDNVALCTTLAEFERRLLREAPLARQRLNPASWERFESTFRTAR